MSTTVRVAFLSMGIALALSATGLAESNYIYGLHDSGGESHMGSSKGWLLFTEGIGNSPTDYGGGNYSSYSNAGYGVIVRLNNGYGSDGTIPNDSLYANFAQRCANFVNASSGVDYWIIGNETNLPREWPGNNNGDPATGQPITVARYVSCYNQCYTKIKQAKPASKVCPTPSGTWSPPWPSQGIEGFVDYWVNILNGIGAGNIDALPIHCYTHGCDPALVTSTAKMGAPYTTIYYNFFVYKNYMAAIPAGMTTKPVLLTECDQNIECADSASPQHAWSNVNSGWVRAIYSEINAWNQANPQKIRCVVLFRWPNDVEGNYTFGIQSLSGVIQDFEQACAYGYQWNVGTMNNNTPTGTNVAPASAAVQTDSNYSTSFPGTLAVDGSLSTKWCSNGNAPPHWIALDLGSSKTVNGFIARMGGAGGELTSYNFKAFKFQSAGSLSGPWTDECTVDNAAQANVVTRSYITPKTLQYVRMYITDTGIDSYARLYEFEVWAAGSPPAAPTGLTATGANGQVSLSWTASGGAASYNVKRSTTNGGPYTTVAGPTTNSYTNTGLTNGTTYYYVVSAVNASGESANSSQASATPTASSPPAPTNLVPTAGNGQVSLTWAASAGAASYNVKRSTTNGGPYSTIAGPTANSYTNTGLSNGTIYYYVVSAINGVGESANSAQAQATPSNPSFPVVLQRGSGLANVFAKLNGGQSAVIAYIGGSITEGAGYRDNITAWFRGLYPNKITEINAGWSGTGSLIGAMRLARNVLAYNPDLIFVEFAVNDLPEDPLLFGERNAEGIVRQAWLQNGNIDVCFLETIAPYTVNSYLAGQYPTAVAAHNATGNLYGVPSVNMGWQLYTHVLAGTPWTNYAPDQVHPNAAGSAVYSNEAVIPYLNMERTRYAPSALHSVPPPLTDFPVMSSTIADFASLSSLPPGWSKQYNQFGLASFIQSSTAGATVSINFTGPEAAVKCQVAADSGDVQYSIDGGAFAPANVTVNGYQYIWAFPVAKTASIGASHTLTLKVTSGVARLVNVESANTNTSTGPLIVLSPTSLSPTSPAGGNAAGQTFTVQNGGSGTLNYSITDNAAWLSVTPATGTSTGEADTITVNYSTASLAAGTYNATITVSDSNAANSPQVVSVALSVVVTCRADFDHDTDVDSVDLAHFQSCITGPNQGPPATGCQDADLDNDNDVDLSDFGIFQKCVSGSNIPADPNCTN